MSLSLSLSLYLCMMSMINDKNTSTISTTSLVSETSPNIRCKLIFIVQVFVILTIIVASLVNLSISHHSAAHSVKKDDQLWLILLSSATGYILPNPKLKGKLKLITN